MIAGSIAQECVQPNLCFLKSHSVCARGRAVEIGNVWWERLDVGPSVRLSAVSTGASIRLLLKSTMLKCRPLQDQGTLRYFVRKGPPSLKIVRYSCHACSYNQCLIQPINFVIQQPICRNMYEFMYIRCVVHGPGSVLGIATAYGLNGPGIESRWGWDFPHLSRPALRPTQPPVQWVPGLSCG